MKILTKEEEEAHYSATLQGGTIGGLLGLGAGILGVYAGSRRFPIIQHLTLPMKAFLTTSTGTFAAIISADRSSRAFEKARHPEEQYRDENERLREQLQAAKSTKERVMDWGRENRYGIVGVSWLASMGIALGIVGRSPYLSTSQKVVQARVYAQGLTLAVLVATAAFEIGDKNEGKGRYETVKVVDPNDPEHKRIIEKTVHHESYEGEDQWKDMVEAEERKMKERQSQAHDYEKQHPNQVKKQVKAKKSEGNKKEQKDQKKDDDEDDEDRGPIAQESDPKLTGGKEKPPNLP